MRAAMRRAGALAVLLLWLASGCGRAGSNPPPAGATPAPPQGSATQPAVLRAPEVRFGLSGDIMGANAWALFDGKGYTYNDYAVRAGYWPRLYELSIPDGTFRPQAAADMPAPVKEEEAYYSATVPLRADLKWTDGTALSAEDTAFTVNLALRFQLGFDWQAAYDWTVLDRAEAVDAHTVKFYFKQAPTVAEWQYGALQGPIVQKKYWEGRVHEAAALLPPAELNAQIESVKGQIRETQKHVDDLVTQSLTATGEEARQIQTQLLRQQGNLDQATNALAKAQVTADNAMNAAREALFALDASGEPALGAWIPAGHANGAWVNEANPAQPFGRPNFERATYISYASEAAALAALERGEINGILSADGLASELTAELAPEDTLVINPSARARFAVINPAQPALADAAIRRALLCAVDRAALARELSAAPLMLMVPPANRMWSNPAAAATCGEGLDNITGYDPQRAINILKSAGYTWTREPAGQQAAMGLLTPDGAPFPPLALLAPPEAVDAASAKAAQALADAARRIGIPVSVQTTGPADIRYAIFNDGGYDLAMAGWQLSRYPGYLCDWFGDGNPFGYHDVAVWNACAGLATTSDLEAVRQKMFQLQTMLAANPPFIPLYAAAVRDAFRGIRYPFQGIEGGLGGVYGAPGLVLPAGQ